MDLQRKKKFKSDIEPHGHSFEAVVSFKECYDRHDQFYTYKINDRRGNPDQPSSFFLNKFFKMEALNLDCAGDHFTSSEFCFLTESINVVGVSLY